MLRLVSVLGLFAMVGVAWLLSSHKRRVSPRVIVGGLVLQMVFALLVMKTETGSAIFHFLGNIFTSLIGNVQEGSRFVFNINVPEGENYPPQEILLQSFAFGVLPTIIFFSALMSILYHLRILQRVVEWTAWIMQKSLGTSGAESLSAAANIFVGQTEAPLVVKPYVDRMTMSELNAVMVGGFATVAGGVLAAYVYLGIDAGHLVTASVISAPAALLIAKVMEPEVEKPDTLGSVKVNVVPESLNVIDAAARGAADGMKLAINVAAMIIAFVALVAMVNALMNWLGSCWHTYVLQSPYDVKWSLELIFGYLFYPFAWLMGIESKDCYLSGQLLGTKMVLNEFVAYEELGQILRDDKEALGKLSDRSEIILTYALSGFANFASIGIQIGGIGGIASDRRSDLARLGLRAMLGGTLACFMTACVAGILWTPEPQQEQPRQQQEEKPEPVEQPDTSREQADSMKPSRSGSHYCSCLSRNRSGSNSLRDVSRTTPLTVSIRKIGRSSQNSASTWRQAPHGVPPPEVAKARALNDRFPSDTAENRATLSAQIVSLYAADSTLHPT